MGMRLFLMAALAGLPVAAQSLTIVSAANFRPVVAPDSFVSVFGQQLSTGTESAGLDPQGALPQELQGTVVEFEGSRAGLHLVSPGQINCVVPRNTPAGAIAVVVRNAATGVTVRGTVRVARTAPALFSSKANGQGAGAILNGITLGGGPFSVETPENPGSDKRTRLAVYGTGFRGAAAQIQAQIRTPDGELLPAAVEYSGAAPVFPGLDQANVVLPAEADVDGELALTLVAGTSASNTVTFRVTALRPARLRAATVETSRASARPGESMSAAVRLNGRAPLGGAQVRLTSSDVAVRVPQVVTVEAGAAEAPFTIQAGAVAGDREVTIAADYQGAATASIRVFPAQTPRLVTLSLTRAAVIAGTAATATIRISQTAGLSGQTVFLRSSNPAVAGVPAQVSVPFGRNEVQLDIPTTTPADSPQDVVLTASLGEDRRDATLQVRSPLALTWIPTSAAGGTPVRLSLALGEAATTGVVVSLSSDDTGVSLPPTVSIARGQETAAINVTTPVVQAARTVTATASMGGLSAAAELVISPRAPAGVESVSLSPEIVRGGSAANGVVRISEPAPVGGAVVSLSADDVLTVRIPGFVIVPAGATSANFALQTFGVSATRRVSISAAWAGVRKTAVLTVN